MGYLERLIRQRARAGSTMESLPRRDATESADIISKQADGQAQMSVAEHDLPGAVTEYTYALNALNAESPSANPFGWRTITLAWPKDVSVPVPKGRWTREPDGTIVAEYTRNELACALALAGAPIADGITESPYALNALNAESPPTGGGPW